MANLVMSFIVTCLALLAGAAFGWAVYTFPLFLPIVAFGAVWWAVYFTISG